MLDPKLARQFALYGAIGAEVAGSVILGIWGGTYLDKVLVSAPLYTVFGMLLGSAAAAWRLWRLTKQLSKDEDESNS